MKIGLSFSRCVRDIVDGKVDLDDVLVIIARTQFNPTSDSQWETIWRGYGGGHTRGNIWSSTEWSAYGDDQEHLFRKVSVNLWDMGKLHQPREFGANPRRLPFYWLEVIPSQDDIDRHPAVKEAYEKFIVLAGLASVRLDLDREKNLL